MFIKIAQLFLSLTILVTLHEFGHFWVGKKCGVKILRYAIGFGPTLWRRVGKDDVEYAINAIPLGGYVKFADTRDGSADPADHARAFDQQSLGKRSLIVLAGPVANLLLAIVGFAVMHMVGVQDDRPVIGAASAYVAEAGFERGDEIVRVGETEVDNWTEAAIELVRAGYAKAQITVVVRNALVPNASTRELSLDLRQIPAKFDEQGALSVLGIEPYFRNPSPLIASLAEGGAAASSGLQVGETITAINGQAVTRSADFIKLLQSSAEAAQGKVLLTLSRNNVSREVEVTAQAVQNGERKIWRLGILFEAFSTVRHMGPIDAFAAGMHDTIFYCTRTVDMIKSLLLGQASSKNVSGPITIAQLAGASAEAGLGEFFRLMAGISLSLFIVNLLPVPILDGGQLLFFAMEKIKGAPLGERAMEAGGIIGILVLFGLMTLAITNDLTRELGL